MKCSIHKRIEATASCERCGKGLCDECRVDVDGRSWCRDCLALAVSRSFDRERRRRSNRLIAGLLSIVPGAGHMYLGFIGKGFALMAFLFSAVFLVILYSASTGMYWMSAYLIPTIAVLFLSYAVFDSIGSAEILREGRSQEELRDPIMDRVWERILLNPRTAAYALLIAGIMGILDLFSRPLDRLLRQNLSLDFPVAALFVPVVLVVVGIIFLRRAGRTR